MRSLTSPPPVPASFSASASSMGGHPPPWPCPRFLAHGGDKLDVTRSRVAGGQLRPHPARGPVPTVCPARVYGGGGVAPVTSIHLRVTSRPSREVRGQRATPSPPPARGSTSQAIRRASAVEAALSPRRPSARARRWRQTCGVPSPAPWTAKGATARPHPHFAKAASPCALTFFSLVNLHPLWRASDWFL